LTAIAYKDGVMAADELLALDGAVDYCKTKARKQNGFLIGVSGKRCPTDAQFDTWFFQMAVNKKTKVERYAALVLGNLPRMGNDKEFSFSALVVDPNGKRYLVDESGGMEPVTTPYWAVGAGQDFCIGAMAAGASARDAVRIAIRHSSSCKGKVRSVEL